MSAADTPAVNFNDIKTFLANALIIFSINGRPNFINGPKRFPRYPPKCVTLYTCALDSSVFADELFVKMLQRLAYYLIRLSVEN